MKLLVVGVVLAIALVCALAGALLGDARHRKVEGAAWGFLLGPLGLLVFVIWTDREGRKRPLNWRDGNGAGWALVAAVVMVGLFAEVAAVTAEAVGALA